MTQGKNTSAHIHNLVAAVALTRVGLTIKIGICTTASIKNTEQIKLCQLRFFVCLLCVNGSAATKTVEDQQQILEAKEPAPESHHRLQMRDPRKLGAKESN